MAYCRFGRDSDVYVYRSSDKYVMHEPGGWTMVFGTREEALQALLDARDDGLKVPDNTFERLRREIKEEGDLYEQS